MKNRLLAAGRLVLVLLALVLCVASLVPLIPSNNWFVRYPEFARVQFALGILALLLILAIIGLPRRSVRYGTLALSALALAANAYALAPYLPGLMRSAEADGQACEGERFTMMVANVQKGNRHQQELFARVREVDPDALVLMETNPWWDRQLESLEDHLPYRVQSVSDAAEYYGMHILSRTPIRQSRFDMTFDANTPTGYADVAFGDQTIQIVGVHPRPPQSFSQSTTLRDGSIAQAAVDVADLERPALLAGDFNAVPWTPIVEAAQTVAGLSAPQEMFGLLPTFRTTSSLVRWPLDQILPNRWMEFRSFQRLEPFGSDHFPVVAQLCVQPSLDGALPPSNLAYPDERAQLRAAIALAERSK